MTREQSITYTRILGIYQLLGGIAGLLLNFYILYTTFFFNFSYILYTLVAFGLTTFCIYAGYKCFQNPLLGLTLSLYNQIAQFVWFTFLGFTYLYNVGLGLFVGFDLSTDVDFMYKIKFLGFGFGKSPPEKMILMINIMPIAVALLIDPIKRAIKSQPTD